VELSERIHYVCRLRLKGADAFVIWYQDDRDGFLRSADGQLVWADSLEDIQALAATLDISLAQDEVAGYDLDSLRDWCSHPSADALECATFLNAWNFFDDLASLHDHPESPYSRLSRDAGSSYDKLFYGCNLPSITPPGERFVPSWQPEELEKIGRVLTTGIRLLEAELQRSASAD
jgi:hypothetical protein